MSSVVFFIGKDDGTVKSYLQRHGGIFAGRKPCSLDQFFLLLTASAQCRFKTDPDLGFPWKCSPPRSAAQDRVITVTFSVSGSRLWLREVGFSKSLSLSVSKSKSIFFILYFFDPDPDPDPDFDFD
ncbi:MAG: hypothetical protein R6U40_01405 [Desulfobacterales bacterium]